MVWLDAYERTARLAPGLLALLPLAIAAVTLGLRDAPALALITSLTIAAGGPMILTAHVRTRGRKLEAYLFSDWGGPPTTQLLRYQGPGTQADRQRRRKVIQQATGLNLPSAALEKNEPEEAGGLYRQAVERLIQLTRPLDDPVLRTELRSYGFERNLLGVRTEGLVVASASVILHGALLWVRPAQDWAMAQADVVFGLISAVVMLVGWVAIPSASRVQEAAHRYAAALFKTAESLA